MASLSSIRIPRDAVAVLERVLNLDESHSDALISGLSTGSSRDLPSLNAAVKGAVGDIWQSDEDVDAFTTHFMSMLALGGTHNFSTEELVGAVTQSIGPAGDKAPYIGDDFKRRFIALLNAPDLIAVSKAIDVITEYDNVLHLSRIISDIRPMFSTNASSDPIGAVIVHTLRVSYFEESRIKTLSFAMDAEDLLRLKKVVDRAIEKQIALSSILTSADLPEFDTARKSSDG